MCYPKGAHSLGHRWGQWVTFGAKFNFPLCYPKGAHSLGHRLGQWVTSGCKFNAILRRIRRRYSIMSYTHGNLWTRRSQWCTPIFVFVVFSSRISVFCKKCISLWKTSHRSAKIAPNAYPDTSTDASGRCLDISPSNLGRWGQKNVRNWLRSDEIHVFWARNRPLCTSIQNGGTKGSDFGHKNTFCFHPWPKAKQIYTHPWPKVWWGH